MKKGQFAPAFPGKAVTIKHLTNSLAHIEMWLHAVHQAIETMPRPLRRRHGTDALGDSLYHIETHLHGIRQSLRALPAGNLPDCPVNAAKDMWAQPSNPGGQGLRIHAGCPPPEEDSGYPPHPTGRRSK